MLNKQLLIECLQEEADFYKNVTDERGTAYRQMNLALIDEINSGRFDVKEIEGND